jgi:hypothetical protein
MSCPSISQLLLIAINAFLFGAGIFVFVFGARVDGSGWIEVLKEYVSEVETVLTAVKAFGIIIICVALLGFLAVFLKKKFLLLIYSYGISFVLVILLILAIGSFVFKSAAGEWNNKSYPAEDKEKNFAEKFDTFFCASQGAYICNTATLQEAFGIFLPDVNFDNISNLLNGVKGVNGMCDTYRELITSIEPICAACDVARSFKDLEEILNWANEQCPRTPAKLTWCGQFLITQKFDSIIGVEPYPECRPKFLGLIISSSRTLAIITLLTAAAATIVIFLSCRLRKKEKNRHSDEEYHDHYHQNIQTRYA